MISKRELRVQVQGDQIVVSLPCSLYRIVYYKPDHSPQLLAWNIPDKDDRFAPMRLSEFLA
jgi:hypothetical protein